MYQLTTYGALRKSDNARIPPDPANRDWQEFLAWQDAGGMPDPADPEPVPVYSVSRLRLKLELAERGLLANVETAVQAGGTLPQLYWAEATTFESNHPLVAQIGAAIGLTTEQIKALFKAASEREA